MAPGRVARTAAVALALLAGAGLPVRAASGPPPVLVYVYHQVAPPGWPLAGGDERISPAQFLQECRWIAAHHRQTLTAAQFAAYMAGRYRPHPGALFLTFDNGLEGVYRYAFPILRRTGVHATVFILADRTQGARPGGPLARFLTWGELRRMLRSGLVDVQAEASGLHDKVREGGRWVTPVHRLLRHGRLEGERQYLARLSRDFARQRALFLAHLGYAPTLLVWPFSAWTPQATAVARRYGIRLFFQVGLGFAVPGEAVVPRNGMSLPWEHLSLSVARLDGAWRTGRLDASLHYFWGDPLASGPSPPEASARASAKAASTSRSSTGGNRR